MGRYGEIRGDMGRYGEIWGDMGRYGEMWGDVGRCGEMWGDAGRYGEMTVAHLLVGVVERERDAVPTGEEGAGPEARA